MSDMKKEEFNDDWLMGSPSGPLSVSGEMTSDPTSDGWADWTEKRFQLRWPIFHMELLRLVSEVLVLS